MATEETLRNKLAELLGSGNVSGENPSAESQAEIAINGPEGPEVVYDDEGNVPPRLTDDFSKPLSQRSFFYAFEDSYKIPTYKGTEGNRELKVNVDSPNPGCIDKLKFLHDFLSFQPGVSQDIVPPVPELVMDNFVLGGFHRDKLLSLSNPTSQWTTHDLIPPDPTSEATDNVWHPCFGNGKYVVVSEATGGLIYYSEDGKTWHRANTPKFSDGYFAVAFGGGVFIALGNQSTAISIDGVYWSEGASHEAESADKFIYGGGKFVFIDGNKVYVSTDGSEWDPNEVAPSGTCWSLGYGGGTYIVFMDESDKYYKSEDAITWTEHEFVPTDKDGNSHPQSTFTVSDIAFGSGKFVAVDESNYLYTLEGENPEGVVEVTLLQLRVGNRIKNVHLKDFNSDAPGSFGCAKNITLIDNENNLTYEIGYIHDDPNPQMPYSGLYFSYYNTTGNQDYADEAHWLLQYASTGKTLEEDFTSDDGRVTYLASTRTLVFNTDAEITEISDSDAPGPTPDAPYYKFEIISDTKAVSLMDLKEGDILRSVDLKERNSDAPGSFGCAIDFRIQDDTNSYWYGLEFIDTEPSHEPGLYLISIPSADSVYTESEYHLLQRRSDGMSVSEDFAVTCGHTWEQASMPESAGFMSVAYGDGVFIAVAYESGKAARSTDGGRTWTEVTMPANREWNSVCYGDGVFVAVASSTQYGAISTDGGLTWEDVSLPASRNWQTVAYGGGKFIATVTSNSYWAISTDHGQNWTAFTLSLPGSIQGKEVAYGDGVFVMLDYNASSTAARSTDGVTWTGVTLPYSQMWTSIAYGEGVFVALTTYNLGYGARSTDGGVTWTAITLPAGYSWSSVTYGEGHFVAVSVSSSYCAYSTNGGLTWYTGELPAQATWKSVAYGEGHFVAVAYNSGISTYGTSKLLVSYSAANRELRFYDEVSVTEIVPSDAPGPTPDGPYLSFYIASDGSSGADENWEYNPLHGGEYNSIAFSDKLGTFLAVADDGRYVAYGSDGEKWSVVDLGEQNGFESNRRMLATDNEAETPDKPLLENRFVAIDSSSYTIGAGSKVAVIKNPQSDSPEVCVADVYEARSVAYLPTSLVAWSAHESSSGVRLYDVTNISDGATLGVLDSLHQIVPDGLSITYQVGDIHFATYWGGGNAGLVHSYNNTLARGAFSSFIEDPTGLAFSGGSDGVEATKSIHDITYAALGPIWSLAISSTTNYMLAINNEAGVCLSLYGTGANVTFDSSVLPVDTGFSSVAYLGEEGFLVLSKNVGNLVLVSVNEDCDQFTDIQVSYSALDVSADTQWKELAYGNDKIVVLGREGDMDVCFVSSDAHFWSRVVFPDISVNSLCFGGGIFLALGSGGKYAVSTDGVHWTDKVNSKLSGLTLTQVAGGFVGN